MRDGRLGAAERANYERHLAICSDCARELTELEALRAVLRSRALVPPDELHVRRERIRLLSAFDREAVSPPRRKAWAWPLVCAASLAIMVTTFVARRAPRDVTQDPSAQADATVVRADGLAGWSRRVDGERDLVTLEHGALFIHVGHNAGRRRLLVVLPDGELEDTGTTFTVSADGSRTTRVIVQDGSVVLRLRGQPPLTVSAGQTWLSPSLRAQPAEGPASAAPPSEPAPPQLAVGAQAQPASAPAPAPAPVPDVFALGAQPRPATPNVAQQDPVRDFRAAVSALQRGESREAAGAFARFLDVYPLSPRAEDAAYLRLIALQRAGDLDSMRRAASDYLRRYPNGFRRTEAEALMR